MEDVRVKQYTEISCRAASSPTKFNVAKEDVLDIHREHFTLADGEISFQHL